MAPAEDPARRLAEVAHELNTPLAAILAFTQDLLAADLPPGQREGLLMVLRQARRARLLVAGLLDEARGAAVPPVAIDPAALLDRVAAVFARLCQDRGQTLDWSAADRLPLVEGDAGALEQALGNLLRNASQATPPGGRISLACRLRGRLLEFVVHDTGPGIPPGQLARIFEPFHTTKAPGEGTGLGLPLAQAIVHRHRGTLTAENVPAAEGGGARFTVRLPYLDRRASEREASGRLLLVEDDPDLRRALARYLGRVGWEVEEAADGSAALAALRDGTFRAVVCDAQLPGMDGTALHARVVEDGGDSPPRFVLISGNTAAAGIAAFQERTGVPVLQKPFDLWDLASVLGGGDERPA